MPSATAISPEDYLDLKSGSSLRVLVPIYKADYSSGTSPASSMPVTESPEAVQAREKTITLSAPDLLGFGVAVYRAQAKGNGRIRLRFEAAQTTMDGRTTTGLPEPPLPFPWPHGFQFMRLLYLVRVSGTDHNMALLAAREKVLLDRATRRVQENAEACQSNRMAFCTWIPARVSVRPEDPGPARAPSGK